MVWESSRKGITYCSWAAKEHSPQWGTLKKLQQKETGGAGVDDSTHLLVFSV
jgi:hypothetical protein